MYIYRIVNNHKQIYEHEIIITNQPEQIKKKETRLNNNSGHKD